MSSAVAPFPRGVVDVQTPIQGTAFFPGGYGLWSPDDDPRGQIMVVGQDFNSVRVHKKALLDGTEVHSSATWRELGNILAASCISASRCFFTNFYMGLRDGGCEEGQFPGLPGIRRSQEFKDFTKRCLDFFHTQLHFFRPKLIFTLGLEPLKALATGVFGIPKPSSLTACTDIYRHIKLPHGSTTVVPLTHPSRYRLNINKRKYGPEVGAKAEMFMIADGLQAAFPR
ncbi:MAG TPA: uracil-DNA glycosylase family protein [Candidatus Angelobacter sp.]|jgi:uracil-DNA glycosylase